METKYMENDDNGSSSSKPVAEELKTVKAEHEDGNEKGRVRVLCNNLLFK